MRYYQGFKTITTYFECPINRHARYRETRQTHLKLAQPGEAGDRAVRRFRQQGVKAPAHLIIQPAGKPPW